MIMISERQGVRVHARVGAVFVPAQLARNPKAVFAFGARDPFQLSLRTVTALPDWVCRPPQSWLMLCPLPNVHVTCQLVVAFVPVLVTVTEAWNPPGHWLVTVYTARHPAPEGGVVVGGGEVVGDGGALVGGGDVVGGDVVGGGVLGGGVVTGGVVDCRSP
jgi:hypothetical protein